MMQDLFHRDAADYRWETFDPSFDGERGYAWSLSSFTSKIPQFLGRRVVIDGMSRFIVRDGLIAEYRESPNTANPSTAASPWLSLASSRSGWRRFLRVGPDG
jgi:hypothetical protein